MTEATLDKNKQATPETVYLNAYQPPAFVIDTLNLQIELYDGYTQVTSKLRMHSIYENQPLILQGEQLTLNCILLNGKALMPEDYLLNESTLTIPIVPKQFELEIQTTCCPEKNTALSGLYKSANNYCTQCEAEGFRRITYYLDRPDVLTCFTTTISADKGRYPYLLSNGNLIVAGDLENGRHFATWEDPFKKPCYLFALVAGDFDLIEDTFITQSGKSIALKFYVEKGEAGKARHAVYSLKEAMRWDEVAYGREYDLAIYMIVAVGDFNMGAMENKGLNIFNTKYVLAKPESATDDDYIHVLSVVGHEYFHNWTGNRITCRDWFQLSLKEGLTVFREQAFTEDTLSASVMRIQQVNILREAQFPEDAGPLAHPIRPDSYIEINNFYTATIYNKGAEVLRMLQTILGKSLFRQGMDLYFARHDGEAVTIEDYVKVMEDVSGLNLTQFKRWYTQSGTPLVKAEGYYNANAATFTLTLTQNCEATPQQSEKLPFHIPIRFGLVGKEGRVIPLQLNQEEKVNEVVLHLTEPSQVFEFKHVTEKPTPSILRHFSAPIKLDYSYSDAELLHLGKYDTDPFNRWEAMQRLMLNAILRLIQEVQKNNKPLENLALPTEVLEIFHYLLSNESHDKFFQAEMLLLPSEKYLSEQMTTIDVDAVSAVRQWVATTIAKSHQELLLKLYQDNQTPGQAFQFNMNEIGKRQLKNRCLSYLLLLPNNIEIGMRQFRESLSTNMTDALAALASMANLNVAEREVALSAFYETWQQDALVIDKWFAIQATSKLPNTLENVKQLMRHVAFDIKNPNKVYALIGSFGRRNALRFHAADGSGYVFLREVVQQLDKLNPQISSRMVEPLTSFKRYDKEREAKMRNQLEILRQDKNLSIDLFELVTKSLDNK